MVQSGFVQPLAVTGQRPAGPLPGAEDRLRFIIRLREYSNGRLPRKVQVLRLFVLGAPLSSRSMIYCPWHRAGHVLAVTQKVQINKNPLMSSF